MIVNVEDWLIESPMPRTVLPPPMGQPLLPDVPNWSWHEYGMRTGFWRQHEALASREIPVTLAINGQACLDYPRIAAAAREAGWEFMGHGWRQEPMHRVADQDAAIARTVETNDIAVFALQQHPAREFLDRGVDQFERLHKEGAANARVMAISVHPYITGVPHRIRYLEELLDHIKGTEGVAWMTASEIGDWYRAALDAQT